MAGFEGMVNRQLMLLVLIAIGFLFGKKGFMQPQVRVFLSEIIVKVFMPCSLLGVLTANRLTPQQMRGFGIALAAGFVLETIYFLLARPAVRPFPKEEQIPLRYALTSPNAAFMGIPIIGGIYGPEGLIYLAALLIPINIFMYFFGLRLFLPKQGPRPSLLRQLLHPSIIAVTLGFVMMLTGLRLPLFLGETVIALGGCTTPVSMILIGGILSTVELKTIATPSSLIFCALRLAVIPLISLGAMLLIGAPPLVAGVVVLITGMPAAVSTAALATSYGGNASFASKLIFLSTVLSMFTLPLLALLTSVLLPGAPI